MDCIASACPVMRCLFFKHTATTQIYTLSLHDALPIFNTFLFGVIILIANILKRAFSSQLAAKLRNRLLDERSEERFSRNAETDIVCRLLLEKKKSRDKTNTADHNKRRRHCLLPFTLYR